MPEANKLAAVAFDRYTEICRNQMMSPELINDPAQIANRQIAHARFIVACNFGMAKNV